jgi:predicted  nucleic acid-binding Zn-ribbon protein
VRQFAKKENYSNETFFFVEKIHQLIRDNYRVRDLDEELLIAKEVSVRLHSELEKSEESRLITEKFNLALKQHLDTLKESFDQKLSNVKTKFSNFVFRKFLNLGN